MKCIAITGNFVLYYGWVACDESRNMQIDICVFRGFPSRSIPYSANAAMVRTALLGNPLITDVVVTFSQPGGTACQAFPNIISIQFTEQFGDLSPLVPWMDAQMTARGGNIQVSADGLSTFIDASNRVLVSKVGTKERDLCANRGYCDYTAGVCGCYNTNGDAYGSSDGYGNAGTRGDCGSVTLNDLIMFDLITCRLQVCIHCFHRLACVELSRCCPMLRTWSVSQESNVPMRLLCGLDVRRLLTTCLSCGIGMVNERP